MSLSISTEDDWNAAAELSGVSRTELVRRQGEVEAMCRWFAYDGPDPVGLAVAARRPDGKVFVTHRVAMPSAFEPLLSRALDDLEGPVFVGIDSSEVERASTCERLGLVKDLASVRYQLPFGAALDALPERRRSRRLGIRSARETDADQLFALDCELRRAVPGTEGWVGNRSWFDAELRSPECDDDGYLVGVDERNGTLVGLCRMWRNESGPTLGLLGVVDAWRTGFVAVDLLRETLDRSRLWGHATFEMHTSRSSLQRHVLSAGASVVGGYTRFTRSTR